MAPTPVIENRSATTDPLVGKRKVAEAHEVAVPVRDHAKLYCQGATIRCAFRRPCIPCSYKVGLFDVALDFGLTKMVPNERPEQCPRIAATSNKRVCPTPPIMMEGTLGYRSSMHVLTVGDGDLTFSLALARFLCRNGGRVVATSYEARETCEEVYPNFRKTATELRSLGAELKYQVDGTALKAFLPNGEEKFHRVIWNFPCTAIDKGQDGQNDAMERNKQLVGGFVKSALPLLNVQSGEIHICHKTKPPFNQWRIEDVVLEAVGGTGTKLYYQGRVVLDRATLPPYVPRKALDKKSFPCHDACTYIFGLLEPGMTNTKSTIIPKSACSAVDTIGELQDPHIVAVDTTLLQRLRSRLLLDASNSTGDATRKPTSKRLKTHH